ncbi:Uncharacterised protein [Mycobacterium tuberculosis]|nr:Uncharacterised protein [Mycobacterium tuberculosis]
MYGPLGLISAGEWLPVAWNTPPSSMGFHTSSAPVSAQMCGSCVAAR